MQFCKPTKPERYFIFNTNLVGVEYVGNIIHVSVSRNISKLPKISAENGDKFTFIVPCYSLKNLELNCKNIF